MNTEVTDRKLYTLMHDAQYRTGIAWQNTTYNQPAYTSFYFASDTDWAKVPVPDYWTPGVMPLLEKLIAEYVENGELSGALERQLRNTYKQAKHHLEAGRVQQAIKFMEKFLTQLDDKTQLSSISDGAQKNLTKHAKQLISMWKSEEN
jgi:hypothetical protein